MVDWEEFPTDTDTSKDIIILSRFFRSYQGWPDGWLLSLQTKYRFGQLCVCLTVRRNINAIQI